MLNDGQSGPWQVVADIEFMQGKILKGVAISPRFESRELAESAQSHLLERYGIKAEVEQRVLPG